MPDDLSFGLALRFEVKIDGHDLGAWSKVQGLDVHFDILKFQQGGTDNMTYYAPGRTNYQDVKLFRAMTKDSSKVLDWLSGLQKNPTKGTGSITLLDASGKPVFSWDLRGVLPKTWSGPQLDAGTAAVAVETLELVHEGFLKD